MNFPFPNGWVPPNGIPPEELVKIQQDFLEGWKRISQDASDGHLTPLKDRRFAAPAWQASQPHLLMAHLYLLSADAMSRMVKASAADPAVKNRLEFSVSQWLDALSPANFLVTNPEAQAALLESKGETIVAGMNNLLSDLQKGRITQTDETKFRIGENVATTAGAVVFENKYFQLLQYAPSTSTVFQKPILFVPPCINKFYILDLQPENSLVRHLVDQGLTVFMISWRNPLPEDTDGIEKATWDDYLEHGVLKAIEVTRTISKQAQINALGFCVGGTMLATALAVAAARGEEPVSAVTMLTAMVDFKDTGMLGVFVDEQHARLREQQIGQGGLMSARELGSTFSFLRPNELVWNYVVSNYLKGEKPVAFDLLFWNSDGTNLPGPFFSWYFRNTYLNNKLCRPNRLTCCGELIDMRKVKIPAFIYASREDHIVPWQSAFATLSLFGGDNTFVLGASGHIAGVINPPAKNKRSYWVGSSKANHKNSEEWEQQAIEKPGSWWPAWLEWLTAHSGKRVRAPKVLGDARFKVLEDAPGSYVKVRAI
ncbi:class I poly(R)-hydroxyalkanoic acid synthase [Zwartia vadi]|uniref:class I poly(R)-hydroxyalkanoic acid synthase n=1 Tax=Zwartia vadi TaxID=3058168 RepID=UPI0025B2C07E|nr:class I poly(R)-hydroxyalkanoic acid synthase [Zwartia vadi]MDN3986678.1 class I poly(R)-hydroxyalkanoic acid synthase [Zwartia vadi]